MIRQVIQQVLGSPPVQLISDRDSNVLTLSMRGISNLAANCLQYELEDVFCEVTGAARIQPIRLELVEFERRIYKLLHAATSASTAKRLSPQLGGLRLDRTYDLFLPMFNDPYELHALALIPNWRRHCRYAACVIAEAWEGSLPEYLLNSLAEFDRIYLSANPVESIARMTGRPCSYLPLSVDTLRFSPFPNPPARSIDVLGIGRRSSVTHGALLEMAKRRGSFYYFDTIRMTSGVADGGRQLTFSVIDPAEHRFKLASMLKRSRYFLASRARANDAKLAQVDEISGRFFEGAAAGAIMIGEPPRSGPYLSLFDWPDAVISAPFDDPNIEQLIQQLDADPERCARIRRTNIVNALLRHDSVYRLRTILEDAHMELPTGLLARESRLRELAAIVQNYAM